MDFYDLSRYTQMHERDFEKALSEIKNGKKISHWMWYIFPQIHGLGRSDRSAYYAIKDIGEARAFLDDAYLGNNLRQICSALLVLESDNATEIFGKPDDMKLRSSMTLFACAADENTVFKAVLDKYYNGRECNRTLRILGL